jgi:hypothetical protein
MKKVVIVLAIGCCGYLSADSCAEDGEIAELDVVAELKEMVQEEACKAVADNEELLKKVAEELEVHVE